MPFRFPLEALLKVRSLLEQQERAELGRTVAAQFEQERRLNEADQVCHRYLQQMSDALARGLPATELHWCGLRMQGIENAHAMGEKELEKLKTARTAQTDRYLEARRQKKVVEHLRTDMLAKYSDEIAKREQRMIDDLHLAKLLREKSSSRIASENISYHSD